ncbi:hypothetical protein Dimus_027059 [Dionaea muscipula]
MAASCSFHPMIIVFLVYLHALAFSQVHSIPSPPGTSADCGSLQLLPLAPCLPFVQGSVTEPTQLCCQNLRQVYNQDPNCLCLLLNGTAPISLPINTTLALQLPALCNLQIDPSSCPAAPAPRMPQASPVSFGTNSTSTAAATPTATISPRPSTLQFGLLSAGYKLNYAGSWAAVAAATNLLLACYKEFVIL